jgi:carbamoyltransferase
VKVLGISGRYRDAAAALAVDGQVIAAASEDCFTRVPGIGYAQTGGFPRSAVDACLHAVGLKFADVEQLAIVEDEGIGGAEDGPDGWRPHGVPSQPIDAIHADAVAAAASASGAGAVLVCSTRPATIAAFVPDRDQIKARGVVAGGERLMNAACTLANQLGVVDREPYRGLDRLSVGGDPEFQGELACAITWSESAGMSVDTDRLSALVGAVGGAHPGGLADASSLNVRLQQSRRALAASFTCRLAQVVRDVADNLCARSGLDSITFGGAMFANPRLTTELRRLVGDGLEVAVVPEPAGRALGAALAASKGGHDRLPALALGPSFSETDIKRTLDNCRLEYVYEPDWRRLFLRVSRMLSQGKVVAWFQGAMGFGPRAMGTRSILCDPSSKYARHNMNEYLRLVPLDEPLPVVFAPSVAGECLTRPVSLPLTVLDAAVNGEWRERLASALDWRHYVRVHTVSAAQAPELCELLECHYARTRVPALIETNLCGPGEPVACTPRDAVRTVFSSAIDALVIGRFVLMKDHWLLRNDVD